jgi:hypothetical protein
MEKGREDKIMEEILKNGRSPVDGAALRGEESYCRQTTRLSGRRGILSQGHLLVEGVPVSKTLTIKLWRKLLTVT